MRSGETSQEELFSAATRGVRVAPPEISLRVLFYPDVGEWLFQWVEKGVLIASGHLALSDKYVGVEWQPCVGLKEPAATVALDGAQVLRFAKWLLSKFVLREQNLVLGIAPGSPELQAAVVDRFAELSPLGRQRRKALLESLLLHYCFSAGAAFGLHQKKAGAAGQVGKALLARLTVTQKDDRPKYTSRVLPEVFARVLARRGRPDLRIEYTDVYNRDLAVCSIRSDGRGHLYWRTQAEGKVEEAQTSASAGEIEASLLALALRFPCDWRDICICVENADGTKEPVVEGEADYQVYSQVAYLIERVLGRPAAPEQFPDFDGVPFSDPDKYFRRLERKEQKLAEELARRRELAAERAAARTLKAQQAEERRRETLRREAGQREAVATRSTPRGPVPSVVVRTETPGLQIQSSLLVENSLDRFFTAEAAGMWWVANQSDDLTCLPFCKIERLEYQIRTALRVLGPLRGRALLSDEVGLGKTIEAGLVLKELLTRGMVERFLVLTVPSLVDQWQEELQEKFGLETRTTNEAASRSVDGSFWTVNRAVVASLHTLKQPANAEKAREVQWDILIVDEAHYLRNTQSQAWQAINSLKRRFLLLLTATPVQNSLEELYNLVTLLQPGQLPSPKEFRARFIDPKRPRQPREPDELRRLLGQVMIRNTRANSGLKLPSRRAETVLFEPEAAEQEFWKSWEAEFRTSLRALSASQGSLWGRLLLQAVGSSPAAWLEALEKFPDRKLARTWKERAPLVSSWTRKCQLIPPLTKGEGGVVIFTQFLHTQSALAAYLTSAGVPVFLINGATPAPERQPITEQFRRTGGALLLTHSGTEGRNLQFSHRLVNFDLPWNPMEIEQRIGRLHRLGQQQTVRIYNFVQAGTLQEHLLEILQEKLNLFELVVGETGLVLGEKYTTDEFAEEVLRLWRDNEGKVDEAFAQLGNELASARETYDEVKELDATLFQQDYGST